MPWKGRPSFLRSDVLRLFVRVLVVSMPWKGRPSFLQIAAIFAITIRSYCVNALKGATFISTMLVMSAKKDEKTVSMPWKGRPSFLPGFDRKTNGYSTYMCQCPERGDLHFYEMDFTPAIFTFLVCQCPERGDLHFYCICHAETCWTLWMCQCPERGDLHFYPRLWKPA